jgi:hypothetical protein
VSDSEVEDVSRGYEIDFPQNTDAVIVIRRFEAGESALRLIYGVTTTIIFDGNCRRGFAPIMIHDLKEIEWDGSPGDPLYLRFAERRL